MKKYKIFTTPTCPNCPSVKSFLKSTNVEGEFIDASSKEGFELAKKFNVNSVPTVIFFNDDVEIIRTHSLEETQNEINKIKEE